MNTPPHPIADSCRPRSRGLAVAASALVWVASTGPLAVFASSFTFGSSQSTDAAQLGIVLLSGGLLVTYLATPAAGVVVILWLWWAWANAAAVATAPRWSQGWVIAAWFVPVLNLWVPMAIVSDIARASPRQADPAAGRLRATVALWWTAWLGAWVAHSAATGLPLIGAPGLSSLYLWLALLSALSALLSIVAAAAFTSLALQIADRQDAHRSPPATPPTPPTPQLGATPPVEPQRPIPRWLAPAILGGVVVLVAATGVTLALGAHDAPAEVAAADEDTREGSGANYRGAARAANGALIEFDVTVTATGARGILSRDGGRARAEIIQDETGVLVKGNAAWWRHRYPRRAEQLAQTWVSDPATETLVIDRILRLKPTGLEGDMHPDVGSLKEQPGERVADAEPRSCPPTASWC